MPQAYFLLTFDMLSSPKWPVDYKQYSLFVAQPTHFTAELIAKVKQDVPGAKVCIPHPPALPFG